MTSIQTSISASGSEVNGGTVNNNFGGNGNSLFFTGSNPRSLVTRTVSPEAGETLAFDLIYGDDTNGGENPGTR